MEETEGTRRKEVYMVKQGLNDEGLAYGAMMIFLYLGAAILFWGAWSFTYDLFLTSTINPAITAGEVSLQTANAVGWNVNFIRYAPPIILLFGFVFAVNFAIFKSGGGSVSFTTFYWGFLVFIIACVSGLIMSYFGGWFLDTMLTMAITLPGHDSHFAENSQDQVWWFVNMYYLIMYCIPVLGAVIWGQSIVKRVRTSTYTYR
jgi:hypothetical protein